MPYVNSSIIAITWLFAGLGTLPINQTQIPNVNREWSPDTTSRARATTTLPGMRKRATFPYMVPNAW